MTAAYSKRLVFAATCSGLLLFGIVFSALGPILPAVIARFGIDRASAGALFSLLTLGVLIGSLVFGPAVDRYGYKVPLVFATALMGLGLEAITLGADLAVFRAGVFAVGLGGGIVNGGTNALVADIAGVFPIVLGFVADRYPTLSGTAFSMALVLALCGGMTMPYVTGALADVYGLRASLLVVPFGIAVMAPLFGLAHRARRAVSEWITY